MEAHGIPFSKDQLSAESALRESLDHIADSGNKVSDHIADAGKLMLTTEQAQQIEEALEDIVRVFKFETGTPVEALATIRAARAHEQAEQDLDTCPGCGGVADNGHDREFPPNPYYCTKCSEQAEQEPLMDYERINALREGEQNGAEDAYFFVRPENDTPSLRKMFCQGFERGFHKGLKYASPVRTKDLTNEEQLELARSSVGKSRHWLVAAVIAKFKEKNK